jgi:predicted dehydrogenase
MNPRGNGPDMPFTGMRITHCWDIEREKGAAFAKTYRCEQVKSFEDMVGKVDGIISGGYYNHPWNHVLHQPYLEAGLPNLINRPLSNSLAKTRQIIESARKHGARILVPSSYEHNEAVSRAKAWAATRKINCYTATNVQDDYPTQAARGAIAPLATRILCLSG